MRRERPGSVLVMAILQIVFGVIALLLNICGGGFQLAGGNKLLMPAGNPQAAQQQQFQDDLEKLMREKVPQYDLMQYGELALGLVAAVVMIVSGVGLLKVRRWGRWLAIGYACYSIAHTVLSFIFALVFTVPAMREFIAQESQKPNLPPAQAMALNMMGTTAAIAAYAPLVLLAYPVVLLVVMFLPSVREAFRGAPPDDFEDDLDDEDPEHEADTPRDHGDEPGAFKESDPPP
jgi:hypothetical protein